MAETEGAGQGTSGHTVPSPVFISYASADKTTADQVCAALETAGIPCWIAPRDVKPGANYADAIVRAITSAKALVLIQSGHSIASSHVGKEVERASSKKRPIIALRIDQAPLTPALEYFLSESQWIDAPEIDRSAVYPRLIEAIREPTGVLELHGSGTLATNIVSTASPKRLRTRIFAVAVTALLLLLLAGLLTFKFWPNRRMAAESAMLVVSGTITDKSIAVLPFTDMSEKHDQEYFGDGMAEEILNLLVKIPELKVIGRTSSFQFKSKFNDLRKIGATLGAAYLVEGSVRRAGDHIRVSAQLIDSRDGLPRWSDTYDRNISDVLNVQEEIATSLVRALQMEVSAAGHFDVRTPRKSEAYDNYLRGLHAWNRFDQSGFEEAAVDFRRALEVDPSFELAEEELARTLLMESIWGFAQSHVGFEQARAAADAALRLNPNSALAHAVLGSVHTAYDFDWPAAEDEITTARALAPRDPHVLIFAADECLAVGRWDEAVRLMDSASVADPLHAGIFEDSGAAYVRLGRLAEAEKAARRVLEIAPTYAGGHYNLGVILLLEGKGQAALDEMQRETMSGLGLGGSVLAYHAMNRTKEATTALSQFVTQNGEDFPLGVAEAYAFFGQNEQAFKWLDKAFTTKDPNLWLIKGDPLLKNLEPDPRFKAFLSKMNLPE